MINFKDFLEKDLNTFINVGEFGELHRLGSKEVMMVIEEDNNHKLTGRSNEYEDVTQNVFESMIVIYLKESDYKKPSVGKRINLDDKPYYVAGAYTDAGILKINLMSNESYG